MADGIVQPVVDRIAPHIENCLKKQFNYLCCLKPNIQDLKDADEDLKDKESDLQQRVDGARRNGEQVLSEVQTWLTNADKKRTKNRQILGTPIPGILKIKTRYSLSRKAKKAAESMVGLRGTSSFDRVSNPSLPPSIILPMDPPSAAAEIGSRKQTEDDIIKAMRDGKANVVGLCGMGGVGKTMMAKRIMDRASRNKEGIFEEVVLVAVSQLVDKLKIQSGIADFLGVKFQEETLAARAIRLKARLREGKRKLIVIDDIWEMIELEDLGIPCECGSLCTILLTSRNKDVFHQMNVGAIFEVKILHEEEAWYMFKVNVGDITDDLLSKAREVTNECNGLPLAIVTVARALRGKVKKPILEHALKQLRSSNPEDIPSVIEEVYNPIKLSYDSLENQHAKSLLFLCSFFPEDYNITIQEELLFCSVGLGMFDEINTLEARNRIVMLIEMLKSRFLILDGIDERFVKMHDVVRDVANFIAQKEKHVILQFNSIDDLSGKHPQIDDCSMLSIVPRERITELSMELTFPKVELLRMDGSEYEESQLSDYFFQGMQQLKVLYMKSFSLLSTTPQTIQQLNNLHTLHLVYCYSLKTLSGVGELSCLEILNVRHCGIRELSVEVGKLKRLRILDVSRCSSLKTIMRGVILGLGRLEELKMLWSFKGWESEENRNESGNVTLLELESLTKLAWLEIEINDYSLAAKDLTLSSKIVKFKVIVGGEPLIWNIPYCDNSLSLKFPMEALLSLANWIHLFAKSAGYLVLKGGASNCLDISGYTQNKKVLSLNNCLDEKFCVSPVLEILDLMSLPNLEEILFYGRILKGSANCFGNLNELFIEECRKLRGLFLSSELIKCLSQLRILLIKNCDSLEGVFFIKFEDKDYGKSTRITFSKLKSLWLYNLPSLTSFCKGIHGLHIEFPARFNLEIEKCPKLISFINTGSCPNQHNHFQMFCNTKETVFGSPDRLTIGGYEKDISYLWCHHIPRAFFRGLQKLHIHYCVNIDNSFSYSVAENLVNLKTLSIKGCNEMVYVISDDAETSEANAQIIFRELEVLELISLPKLQTFSKGKWDLQFPLLKEVTISGYPVMGSLISAPDMEDSCSAQHDCVHLFCNKKNTFGGIKELNIRGCVKDIINLWCQHIPHSFFGGLKELTIYGGGNINYLFSYTIAENLVNLKELIIDGCNEMVYVIADDANTHENQLLEFSRLEEVTLRHLPKLQSFCEGKLVLQLPSLVGVDITDCRGMKGFTMGLVTAPMLKEFEVDCENKNVEDLIKYPWVFENLDSSPASSPMEHAAAIKEEDDC